jgi:integrase/recombinase XerC
LTGAIFADKINMVSISIIIANTKKYMPVIQQALQQYLRTIETARSKNTWLTYQNAMNAFSNTLVNHGVDLLTAEITSLPEDTIAWFAGDLRYHSPSTEQLYLTAACGFFEFLSAESLASPNLPRIRLLVRQRSRKPGQRLPQFPREDIEFVINYTNTTQTDMSEDSQLINRRDKAFILTLADTGLRVHEACNLKRGDIDWNEGKAVIIGKGNQQAVVRFSTRSLNALKEYLNYRSKLDGNSGKPLATLPLFARHDPGAGKKVKPITPTTGRNIINQRVIEALGEEKKGTITPHSFRHYFVTTVLRGSGNLKLAQELARHKSIAVTQRYAHLSDNELDQGYWEIFEEPKHSGSNLD